MATKEKNPPATNPEYIPATDEERAKTEALIVKPTEAVSLVGGAGAAAAALARNKGFHIEQVVSLRKGDSVDGVFTGQAGDIQLKDDSLIPAWKVAVTPQVTAVIPGTYKLNQFFRGLTLGTRVVVEHLGKESVGSTEVNRYYCVSFKEDNTPATQSSSDGK